MKKIIVLILPLLFLSACTEERLLEPINPGTGETEEFSFSFTTDGMEGVSVLETRTPLDNSGNMITFTFNEEEDAQTRGVDDNEISEFVVYQFEGTAAGSKLLGIHDGEIVSNSSNTYTVRVALNTDNTATANAFYFIADLDGKNIALGGGKTMTVGSTTLKDFEDYAFLQVGGALQTPTKLPKAGRLDAKLSDLASSNVNLRRMLSKVTVDLKNTPAASDFDSKSVKIINVPTKAWVKSRSASTSPATEDYTTHTLTGTTGTFTWYQAENLCGTGTSTTAAKKTAAALAAGYKPTYMEVTGESVKDKWEVVYSIFLGKNATNDFNVAGNTKYDIKATITGHNDNVDDRVSIVRKLDGNGTANSYMTFEAGKEYSFNATVQGNGETTPASPASLDSDKTSPIAPQPMDPYDAIIIWQAGSGGTANAIIENVRLSTDKKRVLFETTSNRYGNALIGIRAQGKTNEVLWSWHIWACGTSDPTANPHKYRIRNNVVNNLNSPGPWYTAALRGSKDHEIVMTRNLGAHNNTPGDRDNMGLLYQWGRKDPFLPAFDYNTASPSRRAANTTDANFTWRDGSQDTETANPTPAANQAMTAGTPTAGTTIQISPVPNQNHKDGVTAVINYAIAHPTHFITQWNGTTFDWAAPTRALQRDNLWGNPNELPAPGLNQRANDKRGNKSIYDPCPPGWRVAPQDTWTMFTKSGNNQASGTGTNNDGYKNWNVAAKTNGTLPEAQARFTADKGWTFYYDSEDGINSNEVAGQPAGSVFYPASGFRAAMNSSIIQLGTNILCWSSSSVGESIVHADSFYSGNSFCSAFHVGGRYGAFPVRCVQE